MKVAILGATGQIGQCLAEAFHLQWDLILFARNMKSLATVAKRMTPRPEIRALPSFGAQRFDLVINAVGHGDPDKIRANPGSIFDSILDLDQRCLEYLKKFPECSYVTLGTGAMFGSDYAMADESDPSTATLSIPLRRVDTSVLYPAAKRLCEMRHRLLRGLHICDIRVFGFISPKISLDSGFLFAQMIRSIIDQETFRTQPHDVIRDYVGPEEIGGLINCLSDRGFPPGEYDLMSSAPTTKFSILETLSESFGLRYEVVGGAQHRIAEVPARISSDRRASAAGFDAERSSLECVRTTAGEMIKLFRDTAPRSDL